jgi:membrane protease YdiL (CAAX protease family)
MAKSGAIREMVFVYGAICVLTFAVTRLRDLPPLDEWVHLLVGALFLLTAMKLAQREPDGMRRYGIDLGGVLAPTDEDGEDGEDGGSGPFGLFELARTLLAALPRATKELGVALAVATIIFPPFALGFHVYHGPTRPFLPSLPDDAMSFALAQVLVVALPEEALFRGYFQTRLTDVLPRTHLVAGVRVSLVALVIQAALFALVHYVVDFSPARLAVFFPALVFGWLRAWRGGVGAAIFFHAMSNVYADVLVRGWL